MLTATHNRTTILSITANTFDQSQLASAMKILSSLDCKAGGAREAVERAILKLSMGKLHLLQFYVDEANKDWRTLLNWFEI